jgi:hypothetical protein
LGITNPKLHDYRFLADMYRDSYFPDALVDKGKHILIQLCEQIEAQRPASDEELYTLTHAATEAFNTLAEEFTAHGSDIETVARDVIATDFDLIVKAYGFDVDIEEVIAPRDW